MSNLGFKRSQADDCLYVLQDHGNVELLVLVYVDDMAIVGRSNAYVTKFKTNINKIFNITDLRELKWILGIQVS